jgi:taurine--2-oxoglutarate transaminase
MTEFIAACKKHGLLPFANYNRLHVVPPCTITVDEAKEALVRLDSALAVTSKHYVGA